MQIKNSIKVIVCVVIVSHFVGTLVYSSDNFLNSILEAGYDNLLEFERLEMTRDRRVVIEYPSLAEGVADKWFNLGHEDLAFEFDKVYLKTHPEYALFLGTDRHIADKWFRRRNVAFAKVLDSLSLQEFVNSGVGDKWFDRREVEFAMECDRVYLEQAPSMGIEIANKWLARGNDAVACAFAISACVADAGLAWKVLEDWIKKGQFELVDTFANTILERWVSDDDVRINKDLFRKLQLAARINSKLYYDKLRDKDIDSSSMKFIKDTYQEEIYNYSKVLMGVVLREGDKQGYSSINDYLLSKIYIDPDFFNNSKVAKLELYSIVESSLFQLIKRGGIIASLLHVIGLSTKEDPYYRVHILVNYPTRDNVLGLYLPVLKRVQIMCNPLDSAELFAGILAHEWAHQLMNILYDNGSKPYGVMNEKAQREYLEAIEKLKAHIKELGGLLNSNSMRLVVETFKDIFQYYDEEKCEVESIVKLPEIIAKGYYEDVEVQAFLKPLYDYWVKYIALDIESYIEERGEIGLEFM